MSCQDNDIDSLKLELERLEKLISTDRPEESLNDYYFDWTAIPAWQEWDTVRRKIFKLEKIELAEEIEQEEIDEEENSDFDAFINNGEQVGPPIEEEINEFTDDHS